ncbi:uncharacterized protein LOC143150691 [Ptiloglossa arizonensis]|uniref:uncharacterized protein LOC143150691 n=1 Tax=Ptiloglossa arizonensis TaxID=3350558 RepID=UPI003F9F0355
MRAGRDPRVKDRYCGRAPLALRDEQHLAFIVTLNTGSSLKEVSFQLDAFTAGPDDAAFDHADFESSGSLTEQGYRVAMTAVFGHCPDKTEVKHVFRSTERISRDDFEGWVSRKCVGNDSSVDKETLFAMLDKDYKGYLTLEDFRSASKSVDLKVSSSVWKTVFKELDRRKKGYIDFDEFSSVLPTRFVSCHNIVKRLLRCLARGLARGLASR